MINAFVFVVGHLQQVFAEKPKGTFLGRVYTFVVAYNTTLHKSSKTILLLLLSFCCRRATTNVHAMFYSVISYSGLTMGDLPTDAYPFFVVGSLQQLYTCFVVAPLQQIVDKATMSATNVSTFY